MTPTFWTHIAKPYTETVAHAFCLHGSGINDYADGELDLVPWLSQALVRAGFDLVLTYDLARGIEFALPEMKKALAKLLEGQPAPAPAAPLPANLRPYAPPQAPASGDGDLPLPKEPGRAFDLLDQVLNLATRERKIALIFPYSFDILATSSAGYTPPQERVLLEYALNWARNPVWRGSDAAPLLFFISPSISQINPLLAEALYAVDIPAPDYDTRLRFITTYLDSNTVSLADDMTPERFAALTAGLLKVHIMDVIVQARINTVPVSAEMVNARKRDVMDSAYAGVLETEETRGSLDDVAGLDYLVDFFRLSVVEPLKNGDRTRGLMGVLMAGPPGTGKSYLAGKLAAEAGVNFVIFRMSNILGGIVGESERNLEKALAGIRSLTPCIVFVDEIDQAFRRSEGFDGNSVNRNVFGRLLNFMADTSLRGRVLWLGATNRPDLIDGAMLRSGRFDLIVAVLPPDSAPARLDMIRVMARKNGLTLGPSCQGAALVTLAEQTDGYTGADVERIVLKAWSVACQRGSAAIDVEDLDHAVRAVRVIQKDRAAMIRAALDVVNDLDLLPPSYRALAETPQAEPETADEPPIRKARSLTLEPTS